jgi:hypothetical protein
LTAAELLAPFPPEVRAVMEDLRELLRAAVPALGERVLPGWKAIGFRHPEAGHVCALFPLPDEVKLYFEYGARLPDPDGLLAGTTKQTRYVAIRSRRQIRRRALTALIRQAVADRLT